MAQSDMTTAWRKLQDKHGWNDITMLAYALLFINETEQMENFTKFLDKQAKMENELTE